MLRRHKLAGIMVLALLAALAGAMAIGRAGADPVVATVPLGQAQMVWRPVLDTRTGRAFLGQFNAGYVRVRVLDISTGTVLKTVAIVLSPALVVGDNLIAREQLGRVFAVSVPTNGVDPVVGYVIALDARTGRLLYRTPVTLGGMLSSLVVDARARRVFALGFPDYFPRGAMPDPVRDAVHLSIIDATSGRLVRVLRLRPLRQTGSGFSVGPPLAVDTRTNQLYVSAFDGSGIAGPRSTSATARMGSSCTRSPWGATRPAWPSMSRAGVSL